MRFVASRFPAALLVVVGAIGASWWLDLEKRGVAVTWTVPSGLPELDIPIPGGGDALLLLFAALGIFLVSFADEILTARSFASSMASMCERSRRCSRWDRPTWPPD